MKAGHWVRALVFTMSVTVMAGCSGMSGAGSSSASQETAADMPPPAPIEAPPLPSPPANAVYIQPGTDIQAAVDASPAGTFFVIQAGIHRMQSVNPKDGDVFQGENGARLNGSRVLTDFVQQGSYYFVSGQTQGGDFHGECLSTHPRCGYSEDLFIDGELKLHAARRTKPCH